MSILQDFWCTDELALQALAFLPSLDLRQCAEVSKSFNRLAVQSVLDRHEVWDAQQSATLQLANKPNDLDGLSAILLSVHVKSLNYVNFDLIKVTSLSSALKSFRRMQRLVDRVAFVRTVYVHWPSESYCDQSINDRTLAAACKCVEEFLNTTIAKGCTVLQLSGFNAFASRYKLKKNPAITAVETSSRSQPPVERSSTVEKLPTVERSSIWGSAMGYLAYLQTRETSEVSGFSEEANYSRKPSRFSISAPWISLAPSPTLGEVTKLTTFHAYSTKVFRPPFSQWTFTLLKESPVSLMTLCFKDIPDDEVESKLILDRLAEAVPDLTVMYIDGTTPRSLKDVICWLGRFEKLKVVKIEPDCFPSGTNIDDLDLQPLARLSEIRTLTSSPSFLCAYVTARRNMDAGTLPSHILDFIVRYTWISCTPSTISSFIKDIERLYNAIRETAPGAGKRNCTLRINFRFNSFSERAEALDRLWKRLDSNLLKPAEDELEEKLPQDPLCFRPVQTRPPLSLELHLPVTGDVIQRGEIDQELIAFCRLFPSLTKIMLCSPWGADRNPRQYLRKERLDKLRTVCPNLWDGWVY